MDDELIRPASIKEEALKLVEKLSSELELNDKAFRMLNDEISELVDLLREVLNLDVLEADLVDEIECVLERYAVGDS